MKVKKLFSPILIMLIVFTNCFADQNNNTSIDALLLSVMKAYHVPVVGYAIIKDNQVISATTLSIDSRITVSPSSLFQAASISKSVSAYGALKLVSQGELNLDEAVNSKLATWKIPVNQYNQSTPVTLRQLIDMTSGLSVSGFPGHAQGEPLPTLLQILNGVPLANTPPIRVFYQPGTQYFYSGGGFEVLEQLMEDVTHQSFNAWMKNEVLTPLKMQQSVFEYPLEKAKSKEAIPGFLADGTMIKDGWNNYAIAAAGGLWSTPTDLAKFAMDITKAYRSNQGLISEKIARQMLTRQENTDYGLGVVIDGKGKKLNFRKSGHNLGYHNELIMFPNSGDGVIIMTDSENGEYVINYLIPLIAKKYHWPVYFPFFDELIKIPEQ